MNTKEEMSDIEILFMSLNKIVSERIDPDQSGLNLCDLVNDKIELNDEERIKIHIQFGVILYGINYYYHYRMIEIFDDIMKSKNNLSNDQKKILLNTLKLVKKMRKNYSEIYENNLSYLSSK